MLEAEAYRRGCDQEPADDEHDGRFAAAVCWPRVLELYAGSGALAIEALSRGADRAALVEPNAAARRVIADNLLRTGLTERATIHGLSSDVAVSTLAGLYDLILLDPPYDEPDVPRLLERLVMRGTVASSAVLVWEHRRTITPLDVMGDASRGWRRLKTNTHGTSAISLYAVVTAGGAN